MLPVELTIPPVKILPCVALPVELIMPPVKTLPPVMFAADVIVLVADINPAVRIFPPVILATTDAPVESIFTRSTKLLVPVLPGVFVCRLR